MALRPPTSRLQIDAMFDREIRKRMGTIAWLAPDGEFPKVSASIPYYVVDPDNGSTAIGQVACAGWRAVVFTRDRIVLAGIERQGRTERFCGLRLGAYPTYFFKACAYAEKKLADSPYDYSPAILFVVPSKTFYLWLHDVDDWFVRIPILQKRPKFRLMPRIRLAGTMLNRLSIDPARTAPCTQRGHDR